MSRRNRHNGDYSIPDDVQVFAEADFDEFRHENKGYYKKKKMNWGKIERKKIDLK